MKVYTVAVGKIPNTPPTMWSKETKQAVEVIRSLRGVVGVHPRYPDGMLLLFKTKNDAIEGKNILDLNNLDTGDIIGEVNIDA